LSASIPNFGEKNVLANGIRTWPPSASAANTRSASASLLAVSDSEKPWNSVLPPHSPSDP
jgi:hypothetical protein